jgi:3-phosphoshikimate 1-carboxyvinyltransferase
MSDWLVHPAPPLAGDVTVPGDKSIGHRAVLFAALTDGPCEIRGLSGGEDNLRTVAALAAQGVRIDSAPAHVTVHGAGFPGLRAPAAPIDCGNSGTSMRLLAGLAAGRPFTTQLSGDEYLSRRPMRRVAEPLRLMGATLSGVAGAKPGELLPPLTISGGNLVGITYTLPVPSAQVKSAVLIAGLQAAGGTETREAAPTRDHTERMLAWLGAPIDRPAPGITRVAAVDRLRARPLVVPGDPSSAAFLIAAALVTGGGARVRGVCVNPTRTGFLDALRAMGARIDEEDRREEAGEPVADLVIPPGQGSLAACELAGDLVVRAIDEIPILAVVAARAAGDTVVRDAAELRVKESDRVATTVRALRAFGVDAEERPDGLLVRGLAGAPFRAADVDSAGDHRIAMSAAVAALAVAPGSAPSRVRDVANVATSFPGFAERLAALGASCQPY